MTSLTVRGRFAPSPTGTLHLGNFRTALLAWLFARSTGGTFVLRMEDLDMPRVRVDSAMRQLHDLRWLGLDWDEGPDVGGPVGPYAQSARTATYEGELARLRDLGLLYPCYCTRAEMNHAASAPQSDEPPPYPGTCRNLSSSARKRYETEGRRPALRFRAPSAPIEFTDEFAGHVVQNVATSAGDFVVRRSDGIVAYQFAVVVDDALMRITQVVRGADLLASTSRQLALYAALGYASPTQFAHVPLALDEAGTRMAKRNASASIDALRDSGVSPERILGALAASCGLWPPGISATVGELRASFAPERIWQSASAIQVDAAPW